MLGRIRLTREIKSAKPRGVALHILQNFRAAALKRKVVAHPLAAPASQ